MRTEWKLVLSASIDATGERQNHRCRNRIRRFHWVVQINGWIIHRWMVPLPSLKRHSCPCFVPRYIQIDKSIKRAITDQNMIYTEYDVRNISWLLCRLTYLLCTEGKFYEPRGWIRWFPYDWMRLNLLLLLFLWKLFTQYYSIILFQ